MTWNARNLRAMALFGAWRLDGIVGVVLKVRFDDDGGGGRSDGFVLANGRGE